MVFYKVIHSWYCTRRADEGVIGLLAGRSVPEFIDPVFTKTSPKRSFSLNRKRAFWLVFAKTGSIISGTELKRNDQLRRIWVSWVVIHSQLAVMTVCTKVPDCSA